MSCDAVSQVLKFQLRGTVGSRHDGSLPFEIDFEVVESNLLESGLRRRMVKKGKGHKWTSLGEGILFYESKLTDDLNSSVVRTRVKVR